MGKKIFYILTVFILLLSLNFVQAQIRVGQVPQNVEDEFSIEPEGIEVEVWQDNLDVPWDLIFLPGSQRALFTERGGNIRLIENGSLKNRKKH